MIRTNNLLKEYQIKKSTFFDLPVEKIIYNYEHYQSPQPTKFNKIIIHHTGKNNNIEDIIKTHIAKKKFSAIGYHFLIKKNGTIIYSRNIKYSGAHTYGYNKNSIGIALFGNLNKDKPTEKQITVLKNLIKEIISHIHTIKYLLGHNEAIYKQIKRKFWKKIQLPPLNIRKYQNVEEIQKFQLRISSKLLSVEPTIETINLIKKFRTCPGTHFYSKLIELRKEFNLKK